MKTQKEVIEEVFKDLYEDLIAALITERSLSGNTSSGGIVAKVGC
jgi:hypothetical protein